MHRRGAICATETVVAEERPGGRPGHADLPGPSGRLGSTSAPQAPAGAGWMTWGARPGCSVLWVVCLLYLAQGLQRCTSLPLEYLLKDDLNATPAASQAISAVTQLPWLTKPLLALAVDLSPLGQKYSKPAFLGASALLTCLAWLAVCMDSIPQNGVLVALLTASSAAAMSDVIADGLICCAGFQHSKGEAAKQGRGLDVLGLLAVARGCKTAGQVLGEAFGGQLVQLLGARTTLAGSAVVIPGIIFIASLVLSQSSQGPSKFLGSSSAIAVPQLMPKLQRLWAGVQQPQFLACMAVLTLVGACPNPGVALFYFYTSLGSQGGLGLQPTFVGQLRTGMAAARAGALLVHTSHLSTVAPVGLLSWVAWVGTALGVLQSAVVMWSGVLQPGSALVYAVVAGMVVTSMALSALVRVSSITVLGMAAKACSQTGMESCMFAVLMAVWNGSHLLGRLSSSVLMALFGITKTSFANLPAMLLVCSVSMLAPVAARSLSTPPPPSDEHLMKPKKAH